MIVTNVIYAVLVLQTNGDFKVVYPNKASTNYTWHVEESADLTNWFAFYYDASVTNVPLVSMGPNTFVRLVGEPFKPTP